MKKIISFFIIFSFFFEVISCNSDDRDIEPEPPYDPLSVNTFDFYTNGEKLELLKYRINAHYFSCGQEDIHLLVTAYKEETGTSVEIDFLINKYGKLKRFVIHGQGYHHYSSYYASDKWLKIKDLQIEPENQYIKFSLEGTVYRDYDNAPMEISGNFEINFFSPSSCSTYNQYINLDNETKFLSMDVWKQTISEQGQIINVKYEANEPDGWQFVLNGLKKNIYEMDLGTYEFDFSRENEFIEFNEYIGPPKNFMFPNLPEDWLKYDTSGSFTITKHEVIDGHKVTKGTINLNAYENGVLIKSFQNAPFELSDDY
ncbi:MAG: hypothetical protein LBE36_05775 [Flavobacteriaceae bacterium]|jgi:hypothetical protein|nr:hypothetical protein [Flavobacteriaceae bacterium]